MRIFNVGGAEPGGLSRLQLAAALAAACEVELRVCDSEEAANSTLALALSPGAEGEARPWVVFVQTASTLPSPPPLPSPLDVTMDSSDSSAVWGGTFKTMKQTLEGLVAGAEVGAGK